MQPSQREGKQSPTGWQFGNRLPARSKWLGSLHKPNGGRNRHESRGRDEVNVSFAVNNFKVRSWIYHPCAVRTIVPLRVSGPLIIPMDLSRGSGVYRPSQNSVECRL